MATGAQWLVRAAPSGDNKRVKTLHLIVDTAHFETTKAGGALDPDALDGAVLGQDALDRAALDRCALDRAAAILRAGGLVALPTETVYGLGANALDRSAVERIFAAKSRPAWDPIIVHIASEAMLEGLVEEVPAAARRLMKHFWPGPLTLLLPRAPAVPDAVTAGRPLVGVRMPAHPVALELIRRAGVPVAAPSANRFGHISPTTAQHVLDDLDGRIDAILDAGPSPHGVESTVLDPSTTPMVIYRPGAVTAEQIREVAGPVEMYRSAGQLRETPAEALPSPGVGLRHYAPRARLVLVEAPLAELGACLEEAVKSEPGEQLGVLLPEGVAAPAAIAKKRVFLWGRWNAPEELAQRLYAGLRALDATGCTVILCPLPAAEGIGAALRDRLQKAGTK
jgi:L-threonylcarbamoyladenylate synthase